jgi:DNA-binding ferritin-like protein (Dps family)
MLFYNPNGGVGSIRTNGSTTAFNTTSDQRLKENIADADDAGSKIDAIQVRKYDWKADGSHQDYGMIAQELLEVAPEAVSQGETEEEMMGVDYSKLVPMLVKEIQSLRARVAQLEN